MIGGGFDGTYYGEKGNENIISALGNRTPFTGLTYDNHHQADEADGRHEGRGGRLRRVAVVDRVGQGHCRTSRRRRRASRPCT